MERLGIYFTFTLISDLISALSKFLSAMTHHSPRDSFISPVKIHSSSSTLTLATYSQPIHSGSNSPLTDILLISISSVPFGYATRLGGTAGGWECYM